ncbi:MAG: SDR family NAD(P)-dependent oxidoreductase, partial [Clostridia bacterium]|nr:SDR family NAD(P)-dependent oxidoreductase [Clostridia bacterium]
MNKVVLVTGGSRGIGKACCIAFAKAGYDVVLNYNAHHDSAVETQKICQEFGIKCVVVKCDVSNEIEVKDMFKLITDEFGCVDVVVNNAGVSHDDLFNNFTQKDFDKVFGVNVLGTMLCAKEAVNMMLKKHSGKIINVSSMWGIVGSSCEVTYSASKAAVVGFTKALAKELGPSGITVNCVCPGVIDTDMNKC